MILSTDLAREIAERVDPPGFDEVVARASAARRRRRTTIASGLAAACVVGGLAVAVAGPGKRPAEPAPPTPQQVDMQLPPDVRAVLDDDRLDLWAASGSANGGVAVLWRGCDQEPCRFAVVTRDGGSVAGVALGASFPRLTEVPGGWLVEDATGVSRVTTDGDRAQIFDVGGNARNGDVLPGDTAVETGGGWRLLRGDKLIPVPNPPDRAMLGAHVTPAGQLLVVTQGIGRTTRVESTEDGERWAVEMSMAPGLRVATVVLAGTGDHVSVAYLGDDLDGSVPLVGLALHREAHMRSVFLDQWLDGALDEEVGDLSSLAVSAAGSTYLTTGSHGLVRTDENGNARAMPLSSHDTSAFSLDDSVCVMAEAGRVDELRCSADDGATWNSIPLPGLR